MSSRVGVQSGKRKYDLAEIGNNPRFFDPVWLLEQWTLPFTSMKRTVDFIFSIPLVIIALVTFPFIAIAIKLDSQGSVFYLQDRVGKDGNPFSVIKYRSMFPDAERDGARFATMNDSRVTRVGIVLRKTRLDEVPQVINVLRGDMSLVGPRPERPHVIADLSRQIPLFKMRTVVRPGLTGWAQVKGSYAASESELAEKLEYDLYYIRNASMRMDIAVMLETALVVLRRKGV